VNILIISQYYWPETVAAGVYITELAESLASNGHEVTVQTGFPHYPEGVIWKDYQGKIYLNETRNNVKIRRSYLYAVKRDKSILLRAVTPLSFSISVFFSSLFNSKQDVIYTIYPILPLALSSLIISKIKKSRIVFGVKDLSIAGLVQSGKLKNKILEKILLYFEIRFYRFAAHIQVATSNQLNYLTHLGISENKITLIPDWVDSSSITPKQKLNNFRKKNLLMNKFLLVYSGNMGYSSDLKTVIESAKFLEMNTDIHFLLAGDGALKDALIDLTKNLNLKNVTFLPFQDRDNFIEVLAASDMSLITLNKNFTTVSSQGKMYSIMSAGRPILAIMNKEAWGADLILDEKIGGCVDPGEPKKLASEILFWYEKNEELIEMGIRARKVIVENFSLDISVSKFEQLFNKSIE
jgi:colanic acid biosynthesis glycosyl transferase WcaI